MASATLAISSSVCRLTQKQSSFPLSLSKNSFISLSTPPPSSPLFSQRLDFRPVISNRPAFPCIPKFSESVVPVVESDSPVIESEPESVSEAAQLVQATASIPKREEIFAVVMVGSRQYIVFPGRWIYTQRLKGANVNDKVVLNKVLLVGTKTAAYIGKPVVTNAAVHAVVEEQLLDKKVIVFKYKKKKNYRRNIGHRQPITRIRITGITGYEDYQASTLF
ncbi:hypothetical protein Nepgr_019189 [Nepenthes gracilis]|uniref:50S ribosomal protein L21, chloroplastic n=1 Tax=Nepenthes gracilis TaxID=150966 RepID=A0AAD3STL1_NEPGR|nr:hypothetical protein Nepgr_019189 [Nepenthes gracilis]